MSDGRKMFLVRVQVAPAPITLYRLTMAGDKREAEELARRWSLDKVESFYLDDIRVVLESWAANKNPDSLVSDFHIIDVEEVSSGRATLHKSEKD